MKSYLLKYIKSGKTAQYVLCVALLVCFFYPAAGIISGNRLVKIPDLNYVSVPFNELFAQYLRANEILLWNPYVGAGAPALPWSAFPVSLNTVADYFFPSDSARHVVYASLAANLLMVLACVPLFRLTKLPLVYAVFFGGLYITSSWVDSLSFFPSNINAFVMLPLVVFTIYKYFEKHKTAYLLLASLFLSVSLLSKANLWVFHLAWASVLFLACVFLNSGGQTKIISLAGFFENIKRLTLLLLLPVLLNLWQIIPIQTAYQNSNRKYPYSSFLKILDPSVHLDFIRSFYVSEFVHVLLVLGAFILSLRYIFRVSTFTLNGVVVLFVAASLYLFGPGTPVAVLNLSHFVFSGATPGSDYFFVFAIVKTRFVPLGLLFYSIVIFSMPSKRHTINVGAVFWFLAGLVLFFYYNIDAPFVKFEQRQLDPLYLFITFLAVIALTIEKKDYILKASIASMLFLILMRYHTQIYLLDVFGIIWYPVRDRYLANLSMLVISAYGLKRLIALCIGVQQAVTSRFARKSDPLDDPGRITAASFPFYLLAAPVFFFGVNNYVHYYLDNFYTAGLKELVSAQESVKKDLAFASEKSGAIFRTYALNLTDSSFPQWLTVGNLQAARLFDPRVYDSMIPKNYIDLLNPFEYGGGYYPEYIGIEPDLPEQAQWIFKKRYSYIRNFSDQGVRQYLYVSALTVDPYILNPNLLMVLNVRYILSPAGSESVRLGYYLDGKNPGEKLKFLKSFSISGKDVNVHEIEDYLPRAYIVDYARVSRSREGVIRQIQNPGFDPGSVGLVDRRLPLPDADRPARSDSSVKIINYTPHSIDIDADLKRDGLLILTDTFYPGWKAYVDGAEAEIVRTFHAFRGVFLKRGGHRVAFRYELPYFFPLLIISTAGYAVLSGAVIISFLKNNRSGVSQ